MDLRALALFVIASQSPSHAAAARVAGVAAPTVTGAVRSLEDGLGLTLFQPGVAGLVPTDAGRWLSHRAEGILQLTEALVEAPEPLRLLHVRANLRLTFGRLSRASAAAARGFWRECPGWLADPRFPSAYDRPEDMAQPADILLGYAEDAGAGEELPLFEDEWVAVTNRSGVALADMELWLPPVSTPQERLALNWCARNGLPVPQRLHEDAAILARLSRSGGATALLTPHSLISANLARQRPGLSDHVVAPLDPPLASPITARITATGPERIAAARAYIRRLARILAATPAPAPYAPALGMSHLRGLDALLRAGTMTAAARGLNLSQPALSAQLRRIEAALGAELFHREARGLVATGGMRMRAPLLATVLECVHDIPRAARYIAAQDRSEVTLGVTAAPGLSPALAAALAQALEEWRALLPHAAVRLEEGPAATLRTALRRGDLGLALLDVVGPARPGRDLAPLGALVCAARDPAAPPILPAAAEGVAEALSLFDMRFVPPDALLQGAGPAVALALAQSGFGSAILPARLAEGRGLTLTPLAPATQMRLAVEITPERGLGEAERLLLHCLRRAFGGVRPPTAPGSAPDAPVPHRKAVR
ncbi:MAG: LysR family transcriptional regulator [Tropicimonas sp.]|uniref:LysR family transcriptional regulator n=1 Tax=Tropicimonas sp. TaxID=2067044 RepID=UPI003A89B489